MRQIILDTETTGLNARLGDRLIEIGCIEMVNRRFTGNNWHNYVNPERRIDEGAKAVHGISEEFLADKPKFADVSAEFVEYIRGAELIIHNAAFDIEFLDAEFARVGLGRVVDHGVTISDTLKMARELHPGKRNSLDALCDRYQINNNHRRIAWPLALRRRARLCRRPVWKKSAPNRSNWCFWLQTPKSEGRTKNCWPGSTRNPADAASG